MVNCPKCGKEMKATSLQAHLDNPNIHGSDSDPKASTFGGQIGRAYDPNFNFQVSDVTKSQSASRSATIRVLPKGESQTRHVFRQTGLAVIRKVGENAREDTEWA